jgi:hypothetical protein
MPDKPERLRLESARRGWLLVGVLGTAMVCLAAVLLATQPSWGMVVPSTMWGAPGVFLVFWGAGGARSWVSLTPDNLVVRNALRSHTYPWPQVERFEVIPPFPSGRATIQAAVKLSNGRITAISCSALAFGMVWNGGKRWQTVSDFVQRLTLEHRQIRSGARHP